MKVLHVMGRFAASGTERQLLSMLLAARGEYWEPTLLILRPGSPFADEAVSTGLRVIQLPDYDDRDLRRVRAFRRELRRVNPDVVHSSLWGANAFVRLTAPWRRRPAIVISERRVEEFRDARSRRLDRLLRARTDKYIGNSKAVADFVVEAHRVSRDRVAVVPNGIDETIFHVTEAVRPASSVPRIGAMGRLVPVKGYDVLVEAIRLVARSHECQVEIAGGGPELERLRTQARGLPIAFIGEIDDRNRVAEFFRSLDVFVHPSLAEGLPNVVLEAAACGTAVVATDAPGISEALSGAHLVPAGDSSALAEAIERALTHRPAAGRHAPEGVQTFDHVAAEHLKAFSEGLERRAAARHRRGWR